MAKITTLIAITIAGHFGSLDGERRWLVAQSRITPITKLIEATPSSPEMKGEASR